MNVLSDSEHEVEVSLKYDEILPEIEEAYKEERKNISLPGFRKGKVPVNMIKKMYGDAIEYQASEKIANKKFWDVVDSKDLKPISTPALTDIDFKPKEKLTFKVKYEVLPKLELKNYTGLKIDKPLFKIKEEDIEKEINNILKSKANYQEIDEVKDKDNRIIADLQRLDENGIAIIGSRSENMTINLGDDNVNPEISEKAVGKKVSDKFTFTFTDEHKHGEETHKETFTYEVEIKKIEQVVIPEVTEELIQELSGKKSKTLDELTQQVRESHESYYKSQSDHIYINSLLNKVVENNNFEPPKGFVETVLKRLVENEKQQTAQRGGKFDEQHALEHLKPRAEWNAKWQIILDNLAKKENIEVSDDDLKKMAEEEAEKTGISVEKLVKYYKDSNRDQALLEDKVVEFLKEKNIANEFDAAEKMKESKGKNK